MKKLTQICIVVFVCLMAATSAGFMNIPRQNDSVKAVESVQAVEMDSNLISIPVATSLADVKNETFQHRPIEPGILFLFGIGVIGIIGIHRLKFK